LLGRQIRLRKWLLHVLSFQIVARASDLRQQSRALGTKKLCRNSRIEQGFNLQPTPAKGRRSNRRSIAVFVAPLVITNRASAAKDIE
jgi:hypothetical protein